MTTEIRKAVVSKFGDESCINVVDATIEDPAAQHVQIRVFYSGMSGADVNMRLGRYPLQKKAPLTPGYCLVGTVVKNGPKSNKYQVGDIVACLTVYDAEAELANMPEKYLVPVPKGIDQQKACCLVLDWTTAYGLVMHCGKVQAGQRVFIHGMSGAVGYATAVLCQLQGATVYGTASARNHETINSLGWTPFVYSNKDWMKSMKDIGGADVIFDPLGFESWDESYEILSSDNGRLVGYGGNLATMNGESERGVLFPTIKLLSRNLMCPIVHKNTKFYYISRDDKTFVPDLLALFELLQQGKIDVRVKAVFDLENIQDAHRSWSKPAPNTGMGSMLINVGA